MGDFRFIRPYCSAIDELSSYSGCHLLGHSKPDIKSRSCIWKGYDELNSPRIIKYESKGVAKQTGGKVNGGEVGGKVVFKEKPWTFFLLVVSIGVVRWCLRENTSLEVL